MRGHFDTGELSDRPTVARPRSTGLSSLVDAVSGQAAPVDDDDDKDDSNAFRPISRLTKLRVCCNELHVCCNELHVCWTNSSVFSSDATIKACNSAVEMSGEGHCGRSGAEVTWARAGLPFVLLCSPTLVLFWARMDLVVLRFGLVPKFWRHRHVL